MELLKVTLKERVTVTAEAGSEVYVTKEQYNLIRDYTEGVGSDPAPAEAKKKSKKK